MDNMLGFNSLTTAIRTRAPGAPASSRHRLPRTKSPRQKTWMAGSALLIALTLCSCENGNKTPLASKTGNHETASNTALEDKSTRTRILAWPGDAIGGMTISVPKSPPEVAQLFNSSLRLVWLKQYDKANEEVERTKEVAKQKFGKTSPEYREALKLLAYVKLNQGLRDIKKPIGITELNDSIQLMEEQIKLSSATGMEKFRDLREMGDFHSQIAHDDHQALRYFALAVATLRSNGSKADQDTSDALYATCMLAHILQKEHKLKEAEPFYAESMRLSQKLLKPGDPVRETIAKETGLLEFKLRKPNEALSCLYPLVTKPTTVAKANDYSMVLFCALIASQVVPGAQDKHQAVADAMLKYSADKFGKNSPQYEFALAENNAAKSGVKPKGALDNKTAYEHALAELAQAEVMASASLARQIQNGAAEHGAITGTSSNEPANQVEKTLPEAQAETAAVGNPTRPQDKNKTQSVPVIPYGQ